MQCSIIYVVLLLNLGKLEMFLVWLLFSHFYYTLLTHTWHDTPSQRTYTLPWHVFPSPLKLSRDLRAANLWQSKKLFMKLEHKSRFNPQILRWLRCWAPNFEVDFYMSFVVSKKERYFSVDHLWTTYFCKVFFFFHCTRKYHLSILKCIWM